MTIYKTKSLVSVSDEKVQENQDRVYFKHLYFFLPQKNSLFTLDIHIIFEMVSTLKG